MAIPRELISYDRGLIAPISTSVPILHYGQCLIPSKNLWNPSKYPLIVRITTSGVKS